jgi:hypothetical protein
MAFVAIMSHIRSFAVYSCGGHSDNDNLEYWAPAPRETPGTMISSGRAAAMGRERIELLYGFIYVARMQQGRRDLGAGLIKLPARHRGSRPADRWTITGCDKGTGDGGERQPNYAGSCRISTHAKELTDMRNELRRKLP